MPLVEKVALLKVVVEEPPIDWFVPLKETLKVEGVNVPPLLVQVPETVMSALATSVAPLSISTSV